MSVPLQACVMLLWSYCHSPLKWKTCSRTLSSMQVASREIGNGSYHGLRGEDWSSRVTRQDTSKAVSNRNWWTNEISALETK